ncbi:MAG: sugar transferase [Myxococcota bacterium]
MTRHQAVFTRNLLLAGDVGLSALAFVIALAIRQWLGTADPTLGPLDGSSIYGPLLLGMVPAWGIALHVTRSAYFRDGLKVATLRYAKAVGIGLVMLMGVSFLLSLHSLSRGFVAIMAVTQLALLVGGRALAVAALSRRPVDHRVLIVGCSEQALRYSESLRRDAWKQELVGFVGVPDEARLAAASPVVAEVEGLAQLLDSQPVDEVIFTVSDRRGAGVLAAIDACQIRGVDVLMGMPAAMQTHGQVQMAQLSGVGMPMLSVSNSPSATGSLMAKRIFDFMGALLLVVLTAPIMAMAAIAIAIESRGPVLFRQERSGRNGRRFTMLKFRSMVVDAEARRAELAHLNEMDGPVFKIRQDPRITRVGAFIRATSIDELPQLFNVMFGHMSLVGPRPPLPREVEQYEPWQRRRLSVRPGITGLWQVSGRNDVDFQQWMKLDLRYIDNWSLRLDLEILARTLPAVVSRTGAS